MVLSILSRLAMTSFSNSASSPYAYGKPKYFTDAGYELKVGDHLIVSRTFYTHHGIYAGEGIVIHYSGFSDGPTSGPVVFDTLETFSGGRAITIRKYSSPSFKGKAVVRRADSRLGENEYDLHSNNCEDFCSWAITGKHRSAQVDFVETVVGCIFPVAAAAAMARKHMSRKDTSSVDGAGSSGVPGWDATVAVVSVLPLSPPIRAVTQAYRWLVK